MDDVNRDRLYVESTQMEKYRALSEGTGARQRASTNAKQMKPFRSLKEVFLLALAMGVLRGRRKPLQNQHELFHSSYLDRMTDLVVLRAVAISETGRVEVIGDDNEVFKIAEEYANGGFEELCHRVNQPGNPVTNLAELLLSFDQSVSSPKKD